MLGIRRNAPAVLALAILAVVLTALAALAAPISNGTGPELISDQQDVNLDANGKHLLDFRDGDNVQTCLSATPIVTFTPRPGALTPGGASPVHVIAGQNTACTIVINVLDKNAQPVRDARVRLAYHAVVKGSSDIQPVAVPAP